MAEVNFEKNFGNVAVDKLMIQNSVAWHGTWHSMVGYGIGVWHGYMVWYGHMVWHGILWYGLLVWNDKL